MGNTDALHYKVKNNPLSTYLRQAEKSSVSHFTMANKQNDTEVELIGP